MISSFRRGLSVPVPTILIIAFCCIAISNGLPLNESPEKTEVSETLNLRTKRAAPSAILDKINVDTYLKNERAVRQQIKCIMKNGPCDSVGKEIKRLMPSVVDDSNVCPECTPTQLQKIKKIVNHLKTNYPNEWAEGVKKYGNVAL